MKIAHFWTRDSGEALDSQGQLIRTTARGWSDNGIEEARLRARDIAQRVARRIVSQPDEAPRYPYGDRPLPEPIVSEFREGDTLSAVITRNSYGALVMNSDRMLFADIDREDRPVAAVPSGLMSLLGSLFGGATTSAPAKVDSVVDEIANVIDRWRLSARIYKTAAGYRVLVTDRLLPVKTSETDALLKELGSDPLYVRLCQMQESFRARLTPKPWRCDVRKPPVEFPFETASDQARFREWEREYDLAIRGYATCAHQKTVGTGRMLPEFETLVRHHDEMTKAISGLPLA
jgi:hypothetical protein